MDVHLEMKMARQLLVLCDRHCNTSAGGISPELCAIITSEYGERIPGDDAEALLGDAKKHCFDETRFNDALRQWVAVGAAEEVDKRLSILRDIEKYLKCALFIMDYASMEWIERFLIALLGSNVRAVRDMTVRLLNVLYDEHNWQVWNDTLLLGGLL